MCALKGSDTFRHGGGKDMQMHGEVERKGKKRLSEEKVKQVH